jgi:hypothetical protein
MRGRTVGRWLTIAALSLGAVTVACDDDDNSTGQGGTGGGVINVTTGRGGSGGAGGVISVTTGVGGQGVIGPGGAPPMAGAGGIFVGAP